MKLTLFIALLCLFFVFSYAQADDNTDDIVEIDDDDDEFEIYDDEDEDSVTVDTTGDEVAPPNETGEQARLVVYKEATQEKGYYGVDQEFTVMFHIYNEGDGAAYDIEVKDEWPEEGFTYLDGSDKVTLLEELGPGESHKFNLTLRTDQAGMFGGFRSEVSYAAYEAARGYTGRKSYSTQSSKMYILNTNMWNEYTKERKLDWFLFYVLSFGIILFPLYNYYNIERNTQNGYPKTA